MRPTKTKKSRGLTWMWHNYKEKSSKKKQMGMWMRHIISHLDLPPSLSLSLGFFLAAHLHDFVRPFFLYRCGCLVLFLLSYVRACLKSNYILRLLFFSFLFFLHPDTKMQQEMRDESENENNDEKRNSIWIEPKTKKWWVLNKSSS